MLSRIGYAIILVCAALNAQISQLATSYDGGTLLFRSTFRLTSEPTLGVQGKIYQWQNGVWTNLATAADPGGGLRLPDVFNPFISQSGDIFGWQVDPGCLRCTVQIGPYYSSEVRGIALPPEFPRAFLKMSANGRYFTADSFPEGGAKYLDSQTGAISNLPISAATRPVIRDIANDGSVLLFDKPDATSLVGNLSTWEPRTGQQLLTSSAAVISAFDPTGTRYATEENRPGKPAFASFVFA